MNFVGLVSSRISLQQSFFDIWLTRGGHQRRHPIQQRYDVVGGNAGLHVSRPLNHHWDAEAAFQGSVLLAMEWCGSAVGPEQQFGSVVRRVNQYRIVCDSKL